MHLQSVTIGIIYARIAAGEIPFTDLYEKANVQNKRSLLLSGKAAFSPR
jgi:hypothetical protein